MKLIAFAAIATQAFAGLFQDVEVLTSDTWADKVENDDDNVWMITFYADWCPYCAPFDTEFTAASNDIALADKKIKFGSVDVMANRDLTTRYGIKRSPTVKVFGVDKSAPEDYVGHRKQADLVSYCNDYATTHNFIVPPPEPEVQYIYNIDAIVQTVVASHEKRVSEAEAAHQQNLVDLNTNIKGEVDTLKKGFETRLEDLIKERQEALQNTADAYKESISGAKSEHARNIARLDQEAIDTIEAIVSKNKEKTDLTEFIPSLGKDWINLEWNYSNRRQISGPTPDVYQGEGDSYGPVMTPEAPAAYVEAPSTPAGQSDAYGAIGAPGAPDYYYGGYGAPSAPSAPSTPGYPEAPSAPDATYGYQQEHYGYQQQPSYQQPSYKQQSYQQQYEQPSYGGYQQQY